MYLHELCLPADFEKTVRLFSLPNLLLFPGVVQPLHVFEPRYREMLKCTLETDRLIATATLFPNAPLADVDRPAIARYVCIGQVMVHEPLSNGTHDILLAGVQRARIDTELPLKNAFREATVTELGDIAPDGLNDEFCETLKELYSSMNSTKFGLEQPPFGRLADAVAFHLPFHQSLKLQLLAECNVAVRAKMICYALNSQEADRMGNRRCAFSSN